MRQNRPKRRQQQSQLRRPTDLHEPVRASWLQVTSSRPDDGEALIRRFVRKVRDDGVLGEARGRLSYEKPSVKRRRKRLASVHLSRKKNAAT